MRKVSLGSVVALIVLAAVAAAGSVAGAPHVLHEWWIRYA